MTAGSDVVVIGGGIVGASIAYQLSLRGQRVTVLERAMLGSGSTSRAAGLLGQLRSSEAATSMLMESLEIVRSIERELGVELFVETGSLRIATTPDRERETRESVAFGQGLGLDIGLVDLAELRSLAPYMTTEDVRAASHCPSDGHLMPAELHAAFVKLARKRGVEFKPHTPARGIAVQRGRAVGVETDAGRIAAGAVVNATGPWSYGVAEGAGAVLPTVAIGHSYITTTPDSRFDVSRSSPAIRDYDHRIYSRPDAGGLLVGIYEAEPQVYDMNELGESFDMSAMRVAQDDLAVAHLLEAARHRFPFLREDISFKITHGIMTFTPNGSPMCGEMPGVADLYHCAGFSGHGIVRSPVVGAIMADLILEGRERYDLEELRADRYAEIPELQERKEITAAGVRSYSSHYGRHEDRRIDSPDASR